ncbi:MAG: DNA cytosine methyltransferase, partial [Myxococcota bacterium]
VPRLTWKTWVRLGLIEPGKDWRSLKTLDWRSLRLVREGYPHAVPDPEVREGRHNNVYRVVRWADHSPAVTGGAGPSSGGLCLNDPRPPRDLGRYCPYGVLRWDRPMGTVTGEAAPGAGVYSVADPRPAREPGRSGPYGVLRWDEAAGAVVGHASHDNSRVSVADPRPLPADHDQPDPVPLIRTLWGGWNRPLTTAELGLIQGFPIDFIFSGRSHTACRERVGNSVPPPAAEAIASTMLHTLLLAAQGTAFQLSALPIWVHPLAIALSMDRPHPELSA